VECSSRSKFAVIPRVLQVLATTKCAPRGRFAAAGRVPAHGRATAEPLLGAPSLRVVAKTGACIVALLAHIRDMGCTSRLASIPF
jgi:hypothetical protein